MCPVNFFEDIYCFVNTTNASCCKIIKTGKLYVSSSSILPSSFSIGSLLLSVLLWIHYQYNLFFLIWFSTFTSFQSAILIEDHVWNFRDKKNHINYASLSQVIHCSTILSGCFSCMCYYFMHYLHPGLCFRIWSTYNQIGFVKNFIQWICMM